MYRLSALLFAGAMLVFSAGCTDSNGSSSEDLAEEIEREVERELDRARDRIEEARERLDDDDMRETRDKVRRSLDSGIESLGQLLEEIGEGIQESSDVEPIAWRDLEDLLPRGTAGFDREISDGETIGVFGFHYSKVEAEYRDGSDRLKVVLIDMGSLSGLASRGFDILDAEVDSEDMDGFERTRDFGGFPGYIRKERDFNEDEWVGIVSIEDRFLVVAEAHGRDLDDDLIEEVMDDIPLRRLGRMAR